MKQIAQVLLAFCIFTLFSVMASADGATSPQELAAKVKQAISDKDASSIEALYSWEGVSPEITKLLKESIGYMLEEPARKSEVRPLPADFQAVQDFGGENYVQNLDVEGEVVLIYSLEDDSITGAMMFGEKNGKYYFSAPVLE